MAKFLATANYSVFVGTATVCALTGVYLLRRYALRGAGVCKSTAMLTGKTVIITGSNVGIGKQTALDLARRNARVVLACRNVEVGEKAADEIRKKTNNKDVICRKLDLASFASVGQFAKEVLEEEKQVDILINNAGVFMLPLRRTEDGIEMHLCVNYLGHFLLTNLLLDRLKEASSARIVNVAADVPTWIGGINFDDINSEKSYNRVKAVTQSKLCVILFSQYLARQLEGTSVTVNTVHPGIVRNEFGRYLDYWYGYFQLVFYPFALLLLKSPWQGAQTSIYCAVAEELEGVTGRHFVDCRMKPAPLPPSLDQDSAERLWKMSAKMTGVTENP